MGVLSRIRNSPGHVVTTAFVPIVRRRCTHERHTAITNTAAESTETNDTETTETVSPVRQRHFGRCCRCCRHFWSLPCNLLAALTRRCLCRLRLRVLATPPFARQTARRCDINIYFSDDFGNVNAAANDVGAYVTRLTCFCNDCI